MGLCMSNPYAYDANLMQAQAAERGALAAELRAQQMAAYNANLTAGRNAALRSEFQAETDLMIERNIAQTELAINQDMLANELAVDRNVIETEMLMNQNNLGAELAMEQAMNPGLIGTQNFAANEMLAMNQGLNLAPI